MRPDHSDKQQPAVSMMFLVLTLLASSALATPTLDRDECPTLKQIGQAFEKEFGVKVGG